MTLTIQELSVIINGVTVINNVSFSIMNGEVLCILGRNGAGKSTLARAIVGHEKCASGRIIINDVDATLLEAYERVRLDLGYTPQEGGIFPDLTVEENLRAAVKNKQSKTEIKKWLEGTFPQLSDKIRLRARYLSGGEQKILAIAMTLISSPRVIIMDEPTGGLMPQLLRQLTEIINRLKSNACSILLLEQKVDFSLGIADRVGLMDRGVLTSVMDPGHLKTREDLVQRYIGIPKKSQ